MVVDSLPISVIVVARNAEQTLEACLESIRKNNPAEIIVVDGNSTDRTVAIAREYTGKVFSDEGKGIGDARQIGAEQATQEYIAYVDSDVTLGDNALATMLFEFRDSKYISLHARVSEDMKCANYWERAQLQHYLIPRADAIGMLTSIFRRETILKYKFDLSSEHLDDVSLEYKLKKAGFKFGTSSVRVYHYWKTDFKHLFAHRYLLGRYLPRAMRKYGPWWYPGYYPPLVTLYWLGYAVVKGRLNLIPYFLVDGVAKTAGWIRGIFDDTRRRV